VFFVAGGQVHRWQPAEAGNGPTFVGVEAGRLARYDAGTGQRLRFLTEAHPGGGDREPSVAGDGSVYFVRGNGTCSSGIWRLPSDGGPEVPVVQPKEGTQSGVAVSPDGRRLAWVEQPCQDVAVLKTKDLQTGAERSFTMDAPPSVEGRPDWSPDDRHLDYFYGRSGGGIGGVRVLDTASNARRADEGMPLHGPAGPNCAQNHPAYRPDGTLVVVTCLDENHPDVVARRFDPASGAPLDVVFALEGTDPLAAGIFGVTSFDLTADSGHVLYEVLADGQFHTWRWDGAGRPTPLTTEGRMPAW
jgi:YD repeat-containing protein